MQGSLELNDDDGCFVCGRSNPIGLKLDFSQEDDKYITYFTPQKEHQGYLGITHGGIICTVMDEIMARYVHILGHNAVTGEISVRLKRPARTGNRLRFTGYIISEEGRIINCGAEAVSDDGTVIATATAKMVKVKAA